MRSRKHASCIVQVAVLRTRIVSGTRHACPAETRVQSGLRRHLNRDLYAYTLISCEQMGMHSADMTISRL